MNRNDIIALISLIAFIVGMSLCMWIETNKTCVDTGWYNWECTNTITGVVTKHEI